MEPEIVQQEVQEEPQAQAPQQEFVSKAEYEKVAGELAGLRETLAGQGQKLGILDKVAEIITGKSEGDALSKEDALVVGELKRLLPHVLPNAKFLDQAPQLQKMVQEASRGAAEAMTQAAFGYQLELQQEAGLGVDDPKFNYFLGNSIKEWINQDPDRRARFWRGDRTVIHEGFKEVKDIFAPTKRAEKKAILTTVNARPKNAGPSVGAGTGATPETGIDFTDRKSVRAGLKAALNF